MENEAMAGTAADLGAPAAVLADPNELTFRIPNTETDIGVNLASIPADVRMDLLKKGVRDYITNSVNQANVRHKKALEPFEAFEKASEVNPLQTAVPKPEGERPTVDLLKPAADARARLYSGEMRKQGEPGKPRETRDPLVKIVTDAVVRELFEKTKANDSKYKWTDAVKAVGGDGVAYLDAAIATKVAAGADAEVLGKFKEERYMKPARMILGQTDNKATKDNSIL